MGSSWLNIRLDRRISFCKREKKKGVKKSANWKVNFYDLFNTYNIKWVCASKVDFLALLTAQHHQPLPWKLTRKNVSIDKSLGLLTTFSFTIFCFNNS
jgi:hypothetical protein